MRVWPGCCLETEGPKRKSNSPTTSSRRSSGYVRTEPLTARSSPRRGIARQCPQRPDTCWWWREALHANQFGGSVEQEQKREQSRNETARPGRRPTRARKPGPMGHCGPFCGGGSAALAAGLPVLAAPPDRSGERVLARFGMIQRPHRCSPVRPGPAGGFCCWRCRRWSRPGCSRRPTTSTVRWCPTGSTRWMRCCARRVPRPAGCGPRRGGPPDRPGRAGPGVGAGSAPEVKTIRRKIKLLAEAGNAGQWITAMARRHLDARPGQAAVFWRRWACAGLSGHPQDRQTHVPRLSSPPRPRWKPGSPTPAGIRCWW